MAYDKETGTIKVTGDPKQFEIDSFKHFEEITRRLAEDPNCPPEIIQQHEELKKANKAVEDFKTLKSISEQSRLMKAYYYEPPSKPKLTWQERLRSLSKPAKASIVFMTLWTVFVIYRTADYHYLLGRELEQWDSSGFLMNWLAVPGTFAAIYFGMRWIFADKDSPKVVKNNLVAEFDREMSNWPTAQSNSALQLIKAVIEEDHKRVGQLIPELTPDNFTKVVEFVKHMEKGPIKKQ